MLFLAGWMNDNKNVHGRALFYLSGIPMIVGAVLMIFIRKWRRKETLIIEEKKYLEEEDHTMIQLITSL